MDVHVGDVHGLTTAEEHLDLDYTHLSLTDRLHEPYDALGQLWRDDCVGFFG